MSSQGRCGANATRGRYVRGCRCVDCKKANARYSKRNTILGSDLVDSAPVRAHLHMLRASGVGRRRIVELSGVSETVVARLLGIDRSKPAARVRPDTARRLLAIRPGDVSDGVTVSAAGTRIRLRALIAIGWTQRALAERIGVTPANFTPLIADATEKVTAKRARIVAQVYQELADTPGPSQRSINHGTTRGWPRPIDLDDECIDLDGYHPVRFDRSQQNGARVTSEEIQDLLEMGLDVPRIATRLGLAERTVYRHLNRDAA